MTTTLRQIDDFLALKRIAVVGVSHEPKDFSRLLFRELKQRGYDLVPVHPRAAASLKKPAGKRLWTPGPEATSTIW